MRDAGEGECPGGAARAVEEPAWRSAEPRAREQIAGDLDRLNAAEREISVRRRALHERIDAVYLSAPLTDAQRVLLDQLEEDERQISGTRRRLHRRIDTLRAEIGLPPWGHRFELEVEA